MLRIYVTVFFLMSTTVFFGQKKMDEPTSYLDDFSISWEKKQDSLFLIVQNKLRVALQFYFYSRKDSSELNSFLVPQKESFILYKAKFKGSENDFKQQFNDSIRLAYYWGHTSIITPDTEYLYRLPFKKNKKYEVSQSFFGKSTHSQEHSHYAIDFQLNVGEPVHAAREGVVIKVIDWFTKQGGPELVKAANKIVILHSDGTMASYVHLDYQGSLVKEGDKVEKGQEIGVSGLTGNTSGAHLHFVVRKEKDLSIPIYFEGYENKVLKAGKRYKVIK